MYSYLTFIAEYANSNSLIYDSLAKEVNPYLLEVTFYFCTLYTTFC